MQIYIHRNNEQLGPFTEAEVRAQLASGAISPQDHVWWQGQANWVPLGQSSLMASGSPVTPGTAAVPSVDATAPQTSKLAIWSLVCGCLTILCGLLASIPAIILGHLALGEIKKTPGKAGRGLAISGLVLGYIMTLLNIVILIVYMMYLPQIIKMVKEQEQQQQQLLAIPQLPTSSSDQTPASTNSDETTNVPDQTTPAPATTNTPDQSTNSAPVSPATPDQSTNSAPAATNSPDQSTNSSTPGTNAPDSSTNAAPVNP